MTFLVAQYDPWIVVASMLVAVLAAHVAFDVAERTRVDERSVALTWWIGGAISLGTGLWSVQYLGLQALSLPVDLGHDGPLIFMSWLAGIAAAGVVLGAAGHGQWPLRRLMHVTVVVAICLWAMSFLGVASLRMVPGIVWNWLLLAGSMALALLAASAAMILISWLRRSGQARPARHRWMAATVVGLAISAMHYTGMAAAGFTEDAVSLAGGTSNSAGLLFLVMLGTVVLLALTLLTSILDGRMQGRAMRLAASLQDANASLRTANDELRKRAFMDPLTGLARRDLFEDRLQSAIKKVSAEQRRLAVLFIDLDGFKPVNDCYGHATGDDVLKEAAIRLRFAARGGDTVARVGGDEFLLLMDDVGSSDECEALARRLIDAFSLPFSTGEHEVHIGASIGIVVYPDHGQADRLIANADAAMYAAKRAGGNTFAQFEPDMEVNTAEQLHLAKDLRAAIDGDQLELVYQPKVDAASGRICGVEALLRWDHPRRGIIQPGLFIPIAERFGLINAIGNWVIDEACRQLREWADCGLRMRVAVNVSIQQLLQHDFVERIDAALQRNRLEGAQLLCEITETVAMEDLKATQRTFDGLGRIGVFLSIDDFGTGYSSLSYLRQLPARQLKIDRSFVNDLGVSADARAVVDAVVRLGHALGLRVVAEGVETEAQRDILLELGCDELQGFYFARPMSASALQVWASIEAPVGTPRFTASILGGVSLSQLSKAQTGA